MLQIYDARERRIVAVADLLLSAASTAARPLRRARALPDPPRRILLLRLERIGDLLMAVPAIADIRALAPAADIDLVVGSWNHSLAGAIADVTTVETLDARWLDRDGGGRGPLALVNTARGWRARRYDLAVNFEPDIRTNLMLAASGARWTAGYRSGGGGPLLDVALEYDPRTHTTANARRLVAAVFGRSAPFVAPRLGLPDSAVTTARALLPAERPGPLVAVQVGGGRGIKQWDPERFADVAARLARERSATIVLTGAPVDRPLVERAKALIPAAAVVDAVGRLDLLGLAALLRETDLLVTGDTGPMHLAAAVGTPVVAVFGPSDPARYAPQGPRDRVVRLDLPCSPCNRIRLPPTRCAGRTPDCLAFLPADQIFAAAVSSLDDGERRGAAAVGHATA